MANKMLIDATHPEETRVVVLRGNRVEEFDFESADKKQLRGNIYLAKVTRVEPSLQAAFVDYGGNRHGFLAFSEIHPDYYQIPVSDRQELLNEDALAHDEDEEESRNHRRSRRHRRERAEKRRDSDDEKLAGPLPADSEDLSAEEAARGGAADEVSAEASAQSALDEPARGETAADAEKSAVAETEIETAPKIEEDQAVAVHQETAPELDPRHPLPAEPEDVALPAH